MISSDLNQLLKKIKQHHRSALLRAPLRGAVLLFVLLTSPSRVCTLSVVPLSSRCLLFLLFVLLAFLSSLQLHTIMRASHVEKGLFAARDRKCRASLIIGCTTTTILERLSFRRHSPPAPSSHRTCAARIYIVHTYIETARIFPLFCIYRAAIGEELLKP